MSQEWTTERTNTLIALWNEGLSTAEIGRRLEITKNSVVGKVHRLGLPKRKSPISARTSASGGNASNASPVPAKSAPASASVPAPAAASKSAPAAPRSIGKKIPLEALRPGMCAWPEGDPSTEDFYFCGENVVEGKPYCAAHCARAYVRSSKDSASDRAQEQSQTEGEAAKKSAAA